MPPKPRPVTAKALQALLTRIGSTSSGTKDILLSRFAQDLTQPRLFALRPDWEARQKIDREGREKYDPRRQLRIVSIDMGIKNLAFCDVGVDYADGDAMKPTMDIIRWDKLNLVDATRDLRGPFSHPTLTRKEMAPADPYSLWVLAETAYRFIKKEVLAVGPDIILIERQRWRSASSAAIQQWTVRVNTLEAMLWAVLESIRAEGQIGLHGVKAKDNRMASYKKHYEVWGVDPKRVGQYWLGQHARARAEEEDEAVLALATKELGEDASKKVSAKKLPKSKAEKKAKIALLRTWLSTEPASTVVSTPDSTPTISFTVGHGATMARQALCLPTTARPRKKKAKVGEDGAKVTSEEDTKKKDMQKLDDITDCCLQAAAWVAWESNRLQLYDVWKQKRGDDGTIPELDDEILKGMVKVAGET
jgi:cruciform cutting endonuclease 1